MFAIVVANLTAEDAIFGMMVGVRPATSSQSSQSSSQSSSLDEGGSAGGWIEGM